MIKQKVERIDIWTEGNENPLCFERFYCNGKFMWQIHEDYQVRDECAYGHVDFCGTFAECIEVMKKYLDLEVKK